MIKHLTKQYLRALIFSGLSFVSLAIASQEMDSSMMKIDLESVTVNALSIPSSAQDLPAAVSSITELQLRRADQSIITNELNSAAGVFIQSGALNTNRITIRGIGTRTPFATNKIRAFYGLIPLTDGGGETTIEDIDLSLIQVIELQKGPNASLYGSGLGGVILLQPNEINENTVFLKSTVGSFGLRRLGMGLGVSDSSHRILMSVQSQSLDGYRQNNEVDRQNYFLRYERLLEKGHLGFLALHTNQKAFIPSSLGITDFNESPDQAAFTWGQAEGFEDYGKTLTGVDYELSLSEVLEIKTTAYMNSRDNYEPRPFNILEDRVFGKGFRGQVLFRPWKWDLSSVIEAYSDRYSYSTFENLYQDNPNQGSVKGALLDKNEEIRSFWNYSVSGRVSLFDALKMEVGFNLNQTKFLFNNGQDIKKFDLLVSPRASLMYSLSEDINLFATLSHGFSTPSVEETFNEVGGFNSDIQPETGWNREIGIKGSHSRINYSVVAYSLDIQNLLVTRRTAEDLTFGLNAGSTRHNGIEVESEAIIFSRGRAQLTSQLSYSLNRYTFKDFVNDGSDFSGNRLTGVPERQATLSLNYDYDWIFAGIRTVHVGEMPVNDDNSLFYTDYTLLDAYLGTSIKLDRWQINSTLRINNLLDQKYASMLNINARAFGSSEPRYYYPGNPRNQQLNIELIYAL